MDLKCRIRIPVFAIIGLGPIEPRILTCARMWCWKLTQKSVAIRVHNDHVTYGVPHQFTIPNNYVHILQAEGVSITKWTVANVGVEIGSTAKTYWIFRDKPTRSRIVVSGAIVVKVRLGIEFACCVSKWVCRRARRGGHVSKRIVSIARGHCSA